MEHRRSKYRIFHIWLAVILRYYIERDYTSNHVVCVCLLSCEISERIYTESPVSVSAVKPFHRLNYMGMMSYYNINTAVGKKLCDSFLLIVRLECTLITPMNGD